MPLRDFFDFFVFACYDKNMKKILLIILFAAALVGGSFFVQQTVFAQVFGGRILPTSMTEPCPSGVPTVVGRVCYSFYYIVGLPRPTPLLPTPPGIGLLWPMGKMTASVGRWFLGRAVNGTVTFGALGGF